MGIIDSFGTGGTYLTVQAAYQYLLSIMPLTNDYEFMQVGDCTETGWPGLTDLNLNGHYVEFYCPFTNSHQGDPTKGYKIYVTNSMVIQLRAMAGGLVDNIILDGLYFHRTDGIDTNILYIGSWNAGAAMTYTLKNLIIRGTANNKARGIRIVNSTLQAYYLNNIKFKLLGQGINFQISGGVGADHIVENISVDECGEGIGWSANGQAWDIRNSVCVNCNNGWGVLGGGGNNNLYNCADDDNSLAASGANLINCLANITPANEFKSQTFTSEDYLDLITTGQLAHLGATPAITDNYKGIRGRYRPHIMYGQGMKYSIGATEVQEDRGDRRHEIAMRKLWPVKILLHEDSGVNL